MVGESRKTDVEKIRSSIPKFTYNKEAPPGNCHNPEWIEYWRQVVQEMQELGFHIRMKVDLDDRPPLIRINDFVEYPGEITVSDLDKISVSLSIENIEFPKEIRDERENEPT